VLVTYGADIARLQHPLSIVHVIFIITVYRDIIACRHQFILSPENGFVSPVNRPLLRRSRHFIVGVAHREAVRSRLDIGMSLDNLSRLSCGAFIVAINVLSDLALALGRHDLARGKLRG
jgi:hypothetical protein